MAVDKLRTDEELLKELSAFADLFFKEVLTQRCDPEGMFFLPGLPVTNRELLGSMVTDKTTAEATFQLKNAWNHLILAIKTEQLSDLRLPKLCRLYQLDEMWILALLLGFVQRLDPKYDKAILMLQGDSGRKAADPFLVRALAAYLGIDNSGEFELSCESRKKAELFETGEDTQLVLRSNVFLWLLGIDNETAASQDGFTLYPMISERSAIWKRETQWISAVAKRQLEDPQGELVFELQGRAGAGKKHFCRDVVGRLGYRLCVIRLSNILELGRQEGKELLCRSFFACRMNGGIPYVDLVNCQGNGAVISYWLELIVKEHALVFIGTEADGELPQTLPFAAQKLSLDRLSMEDNLTLWQQIGGRYQVASDVIYEQLAGKYRLLPAVICEVFTRAEQRRLERGMDNIDAALLLSCVRECNQRTANALMERINTTFRWEDLKVKPETARSMQLACAHLKYRFAAQSYLGNRYPYGSGISVLMYGPPGTGKTMAAQVIANELQMDLCRVDLSQISSKYIGETEKNLEKVFREAEQSNVILFFDEADSLFGKRTEVKDSNDKYANQETSYILQRIESYEGMVILATNLTRNFDPAFMRRITVSIQFDLPDAATRLLMWKDMLQNTKLIENETMLQNLAEQFELTGSNIKSVVRNAVFMALMEDRPLGIADIAMAIKIEFEKLGKMVNVSSFGSFYGYIG